MKSEIYIPEDFVQVWQKFKEICKREGKSRSDILRVHVARFVMVHEPGNPQLRLESFVGKIENQCFNCQALKVALFRVKFRSGLVASVCRSCLEEKQTKGLVKHVY